MNPVIIGDATLYLGDKRKRVGADSPLFKGGKTLDANGYVVLSSKMWGKDAAKREHRVVMEKHLGRSLNRHEIVHHINGNKADNRLENLSLESRASHNRAHGTGATLVCVLCGFNKWYSPSGISKLARSQDQYRCRKCYKKP